MNIIETDDKTLMFVFNNKDIKMIKRSPTPLGFKAVKGEKEVSFSFISEGIYERVYAKPMREKKEKLKKMLDEQKKENNGEDTTVH